MHDTPCFPAWGFRLARLGSRTAHACRQVRAYTLCQLENCFSPWVPREFFPKAPAHQNSRDRHYTRWRSFWCTWCGKPSIPTPRAARSCANSKPSSA